MNEVLQSFIKTIPVIKDAFGMDIMMSITDGDKFLAYWPGNKMVADIHVGDKLSHDDPMWTSFTTGRKLQQICPADVYGFAFKAITIAITFSRSTSFFFWSFEEKNFSKVRILLCPPRLLRNFRISS